MHEEQIERLLWRDGAVPERVDLSVIGVVEGATLIEALCCGRFTTNEALLYHEQEGRPPFHVVSSALPVEDEEGRDSASTITPSAGVTTSSGFPGTRTRSGRWSS